MTHVLNQTNAALVETRLKEFESNTGCELLLVVANQSDPYPGASWRFGLIGGFILSLTFSYFFDFSHRWLWPLSYFGFSLLMVWIGHFPWAKKLALSDWEVQRECDEKAIELFHTLGTSAVSHKVTAMIMISELEQNIEVLVDKKLAEKISPPELDELIKTMQSHFSSGHAEQGLIASISLLEKKILAAFGGKVTEFTHSQLSDVIHYIKI
jgi:uncharacterized membrane protein